MKIESKRLIGLVIGLIVICIVLSIACIKLWFSGKVKSYMLFTYSAINNMPLEYQQEERELVAKRSKAFNVPENLILGIGTHENGIFNHEYGCKKIAKWIMWLYPEKEWQMVMAMRIVNEEMIDYCIKNDLFFKNDNEMLEHIKHNKKSFTQFLALRYNYKYRTIWSDSVLKLWKKYEKEEK